MTATSLLTAADRRNHPRAQVAKLHRIAARAQARAEWLVSPELIRSGNGNPAKAAESARRARQALTEIIAIAEASDDLDLRRKARARSIDPTIN